MHRHARAAAGLAAISCTALLPAYSQAAILRPFIEVSGSSVHLSDLFDELGTVPDRVLGAAPAPGDRITVNAPQLAAIAHDFDVAWRPSTGAENVVVQRAGQVLSPGVVNALIRKTLEDSGAPPFADISMPGFEPVLMPVGAPVQPELSQVNYDPAGGRFTVLLSVSPPGMPPVQRRLSGQAIPTIETTVPVRALAMGSIVAADDVQALRVHAGLLRGRTAIAAGSAVGMVVRHEVAQGQPLTTGDLGRMILVKAGSAVTMTLSSSGISLTAQGVALDAGSLGDRIRIQNPASHAIVEADVVSAGEVRVLPRATVISLAAAQ